MQVNFVLPYPTAINITKIMQEYIAGTAWSLIIDLRGHNLRFDLGDIPEVVGLLHLMGQNEEKVK